MQWLGVTVQPLCKFGDPEMWKHYYNPLHNVKIPAPRRRLGSYYDTIMDYKTKMANGAAHYGNQFVAGATDIKNTMAGGAANFGKTMAEGFEKLGNWASKCFYEIVISGKRPFQNLNSSTLSPVVICT